MFIAREAEKHVVITRSNDLESDLPCLKLGQQHNQTH